MTYIEIRKLLEDNNIKSDIALDIVSCVNASLWGVDGVSDEKFNLICKYVRTIWDDAEKAYTQLISDVVVDCVYHCFEYYRCEDITLDDDELRDHKRVDEVFRIYMDKYYD